MQDAILKADALIEAHEYIRRFDGSTVVVKVGGSIMDDPATLRSLIEDICFMHAVGIRPVLVHGGGKGITAAMNRAGLEAQFVQGRRYTDERTLAIVEHVLVNEINESLVSTIRELGPRPMGLHSLASCVVFAKRLYLEAPATESGQAEAVADQGRAANSASPAAHRKIDLGHIGDVEWINAELIRALVKAGCIPVIAPVGRDRSGGKLNVNADSVAGHVAAAVQAEKLVLVSDTHGIRTSEDADSFAPHLTREQIQGLIDTGVVTAGMLPKVEACLTALEAGVRKAHIVDGRVPHSLMLEIYTQEGIGTEIVL